MEGLSPTNQAAIIELIDEKVDEIKTGLKKPTKVDHNVYEGLEALFKEESEEKKPKSEEKKPKSEEKKPAHKHADNTNLEGLPELFEEKSEEKKPAKKHVDNTNYEGLPELFEEKSEQQPAKKSSSKWETEEEESLNSDQSQEESSEE